MSGAGGAFRFVEDLTSDVMFEAEAPDLAGLIGTCARAMFSVACDIERVAPKESFRIVVEAENEEALLIESLSRLLTEADIRGLFLADFDAVVARAPGRGLFSVSLTAFGERISRAKGRSVVKGVMYYGFRLNRTASGYVARVAMDV